MLLFDMGELKHNNGQPPGEALQDKLLGQTFERSRQEPRIEVLLAYGLIASEDKGTFTE